LRDIPKIRRICTSFQDALAVKVLLDLLKGLWSSPNDKLYSPKEENADLQSPENTFVIEMKLKDEEPVFHCKLIFH